MKAPKLSVVVSVFNEEDNVLPLYEQVVASLSDIDFELIYSDDGSTDATIQKVKSIEDERVHLVQLKRNYGQSYALKAGIDHASGEYIVTMDGDLQNDPSDIPHMLETAESEDWDLVAGIRKKRKDNIIRTFPSKIANAMIRRATKVYMKDNGCALKVFKADVAKEIGLYGEMHRFIAILAHFDGATIKQVDVKHHPRIHGTSKYGLGRTFKVISDVILMLFFKKYLQRPMHLFGTAGAAMFSIGILINLYLLVEKVLGNDIWGRPLLILGVMLLLAGIQLAIAGIILEFIMRTYYESQNKKPYRVRKVFVGGKEN